jgi:hypothetical protein
MKGYKMTTTTKNSNELYNLVSLRIQGITGLDLDQIGVEMGATIWAVVGDENAYEFAYDLMAQVVIKQYNQTQSEIRASEVEFQNKVNSYWNKQLNA